MEDSPYYPPRANGFSRHFTVPLVRLVNWLGWSGAERFLGVKPWQAAMAVCVPGYAYGVMGYPKVAAAVLTAWVLSALSFFVFLGGTLSNAAFSCCISLHVSSAVQFMLPRFFPESPLGTKISAALMTLLVIGGGVYYPSTKLMDRYWILPLQTPEGPLVISRWNNQPPFKRGEWVAWERETTEMVSGVIVRGGKVFGPVLATGGDQVRFGSGELTVNQDRIRAFPSMPSTGEFFPAKGELMAWPMMTVERQVNISPEVIARGIARIGTIPEKTVLGRPMKRWFFRDQQEIMKKLTRRIKQ